MDKIKELFDTVRKLLTPKQAFSWQTLIMLSVFSYLMALLAFSRLVKEFLASCGWIFLIAGVGWATIENPIQVYSLNLGPWITGALTSTFLFGNFTDLLPSLPYVAWPVLSAAIASLPKFLDGDLKFKIPPAPERQFLVILCLSNLVLSCWIQFYFAIQRWSEQYPSLQTDNFDRSAFVVRFDLRPAPPSRGQFILNQAEQVLKEQVDAKPWPQVERWLFDIQQKPETFGQAVLQQVDQLAQESQRSVQQRAVKVAEDFLWRVEPRITTGNPYNIDLIARWQGPSFNAQGYYLTQFCRITQVAPKTAQSTPSASGPTELPPETLGKVSCGRPGERQFGQPTLEPQ